MIAVIACYENPCFAPHFYRLGSLGSFFDNLFCILLYSVKFEKYLIIKNVIDIQIGYSLNRFDVI